jgi:hypothetical protein
VKRAGIPDQLRTFFGTFLRIALLGAAFGGWPAFAEAQSKVARVGFLSASSLGSLATRVEAFRQGLKELGYIEGRNVAIEYRWAAGKVERLPELAAELERSKVDVIVTAGPSATRAAKQATTTPIVMAFDRRSRRFGVRSQPRAAGRQYHRPFHTRPGDQRKAAGRVEADHSDALARCGSWRLQGAGEQ